MVDQGHYGWALSGGMLVVRTTRAVFSDNKLKERSHTFRVLGLNIKQEVALHTEEFVD